MSSTWRRVVKGLCCAISAAVAVMAVSGAVVSAKPTPAGGPSLAVGALTTEHMSDPLGIDHRNPQLGWVISSSGRGISQARYEIRVAASRRGLRHRAGLVWDSGVVRSGRSFDIAYAGRALQSQTRYYWQVRVWDSRGAVSAWSSPAWFETAFLNASQFKGSWIGDRSSTSPTGPEIYLRKDFTVARRSIVRARLYESGLSFPYTDINGKPISKNLLDTAFTEYGRNDPWQIKHGELNINGGSIAILNEGLGWTDYTMSFDTSIVDNQAGWVLRAASNNTAYVFILDADNDTVGAKSSIQELICQNGSFTSLGTITLPFAVKPGTQYAISSTVSGATITTSVNGKQVGSLDTSTGGQTQLTAGTIGFREDSGEEANFKDLTVTSSSGATLFKSALNSSADIKAFQAPVGTDGASVDYRTFDVTRLLRTGADALAVSLGNGFYAGGADDYGASGEGWQPTQPKLKLELEVWYRNGSTSTVLTNNSWRVTTGPTTVNTPAYEDYDAQLQKPGWTLARYDARGWSRAAVLPAPVAVMRAETIPPVRVTDTLKPVSVKSVGTRLPIPSFTGSTTADWIWNTVGANNAAPIGDSYMRKTFTLGNPSAVSTAVLRVNADDGMKAYVNGHLVAQAGNVVNGWQNSEIANIKPWLIAGTNVIAIEGESWHNNASGVIAVAQIGQARIVTDGTWTALAGQPASAPAGWNTPNFNDSSWGAADVQGAYGVAPWGTNFNTPTPYVKVYTFPIMTSGWAWITMRGRAGEQVNIEYSEKLNSNGTVQPEGENGQTDSYTLKGSAPETYDPKYGWKGYQYIQVWAPSGEPLKIDSITGVVAHTDLARNGSFSSSSSLLNRMQLAQVNTILNNQYSYGSDTPTYEKGGWTNDNGDYATSEMDNFNAEAYYDHMMQNFDDSQETQGNVGNLVPTQSGDDSVDPLWGGSFLLIEYDMYEHYDNLAIIHRDFSHMEAYVNYLDGMIAKTGDIYQGGTFGDWVTPPNDPNPPSSEMLGSMFLYRETMDLSIMARAIGNRTAATKYATTAAAIRAAVNKELYQPATHQYIDPVGEVSDAYGGPNGTITSTAYDQTANVFGIAFGLAPQADRKAIVAGLAANVESLGDHLATGANGSKYILPVLTEYGYGELAYKVATNPTAPGWGQWFLQCHATTMWEAWENSSCDSARSRDHAFMGTVDDWLFSGVAGIQGTSAGFRTVAIDPNPVGNLTDASGSEETPLGPVSSRWTRSGTQFTLTVSVPVGSRASVCVPAASEASVTTGGIAITKASGVTVTGMQSGCLGLRVGSGTYRFQSTLAS